MDYGNSTRKVEKNSDEAYTKKEARRDLNFFIMHNLVYASQDLCRKVKHSAGNMRGRNYQQYAELKKICFFLSSANTSHTNSTFNRKFM